MKVFVSGASNELARVRHAMRLIEGRGARVIGDWTLDVQHAQDSGITSASMSDHAARLAAQRNVVAIHAADAVLFLAPRGTSRDSWVELGVAYTLDKRIVVAGSAARHAISSRLADALFETDDEAIAWLLDVSAAMEAT